MTIKIYTHPDCKPCEPVKEFLKQNKGKIDGEDVELVDITTEEGLAEFEREVLSKGDGEVPSAYRQGQACDIIHKDNKISLKCPKSRR